MRSRRLARTAVVTASMLLTGVMAGCGGASLEGESSSGPEKTVEALPECSDSELKKPDSSVSGTVTAVLEEVSDMEAAAALIPGFNAVYPNVTIEIEGANYDVIREKQIASFQKQEGTYNLLQVDTAWVPEYAESNFLVELGPAIACLGEEYDYEDFSQSFREIGHADGRVYGLPFYSYPTGFIYREDLWDKVPTTLDELVSAAADKAGPGMAGVALQPKQGATVVEEFNAFLLGAGGQMRNEDGTWELDTPEGRTALEAYIKLFKEAAPQGSLNWGFDESIRAASSGKASALTTYGWVTPIVNRDSEQEFRLAPFPGGRGTGGAWQWGIAANGPDRDAAWAWISWITAKEQDVKRTTSGGAPIRESTMDDSKVWEDSGLGQDYFETYKEIAAKAVPICRGTGCAAAVEEIGKALNAAVAGTMTVDEALAQAQQDAEGATG